MDALNRKSWLRRWFFWLSRQPRPALWVRALFLLGAGTIIDVATGLRISIFAFYFVPIFIASFLISASAGIVISLISAGVRLAAYRYVFGDQGWSVPLWNFAVDAVSFFIFTFLLASVREQLQNENTLARRDPLTKAHNSRSFHEALEVEIARARRQKSIFTLVYLDLDNFKSVNDTCGHDAGDEVLIGVAQTMQTTLRAMDIVARLGGDEFVALLPQTGEDGAQNALERLQKSLLEEMERRECNVTFSIGAKAFLSPPASPEIALQGADSAMYNAKKGGKNRICLEIQDASSSLAPA